MSTHVLKALLLSCALVAVAQAQTPLALPGDRVFPENIAAAHDGTLFVGSLGAGGIYKAQAHGGQAQAFIKPGEFGTHSIFGLFADDNSNTLWACSNDLSGLGVSIGTADGSGATLKGFDLKSGRGKISIPLPHNPALCNDMTVGPDGALYVTNTTAPQIFRLQPGATQLQVWFTDPALQPPGGAAGLDGLAFGPDGNLYVDRYTPGDLFRINVKDGKATGFTKLVTSRKTELADAIRLYGKDTFLLVEGAGRLSSFKVQGDNVTLTTLKEGMSTPTGVAIIGSTAWVSEGQLQYIFDKTKKDQSPSLPFKAYPVAIAGAH